MLRVLKFTLILTAAILALSPLPRTTVEQVYSRGIYPMVQPRLTSLSNGAPFALFDAVVLAIVISILALWTVRLRHLRGRSGKAVWLGALAIDTAAIASVVYLWFLAVWGLNYQREPLRAQLDFSEERITREALRALARRNIESLNALYDVAHETGWPEFASTPDALEPAFVRAQRDLAMTWTAAPGQPKRTLFNFYFTRVSIDGMTDPFFLETLANQSLLPFERPSTVAHEWSHLAGYADESEANFVGWLVCMRGTPPVQYSGWLSLYGTVMNALPRSEREELARGLDKGPRADLSALADRVRRQTNPMASRAGYALYDRFLKANRVEAGIRSYGEVLRLLLGTRFTEDGTPVRR
jgi:uncharacterized protein DUF3810